MTDTPSTTRRVILGMPGYGKQTAAAGRAFWKASARHAVDREYANGSLLACNFNKLWCRALNEAHQGRPFDYFAMLHDDIGAEDFWLDTLIDELEAKQLDVLGVVVPIKDTRGITSIALHHPGDNWNADCRLSMHDVFQLPETFTSDDLDGQEILLNTGCWVAKWDQEWCKKVHFEINDRIVFDRCNNCYRPEVESEDWFFSRLMNEMQVKIGATRKVAVRHCGEIDFVNTAPWGSQLFDVESDKYARKTSPVPGYFPADITGWLFPEEGQALAELCRGKRVLEIGSYCGLSTVCIGRTAEHVVAVDYFDGRGTPDPRDTLAEFKSNIERHGLTHKVEIRHPSWLHQGEFPRPEFDVAFIDGAHDFDSVIADAIAAMNLLAPGGVLIFHDYQGTHDPDVNRVVEGLIADGGELISTHKTLAVVKPPAAVLQEI